MFEEIVPYIISVVVTMMYAGVGKLSSGEPFDIVKFAQTMGVQIAALVAFAFTAYFASVDLSALTLALPTVITAIVMKLYAYFTKRPSLIVTAAK
jgi:hypothetical protein